MSTTPQNPTEADAERILHEALGLKAATVRRFPTGLANWVYDVTTVDGDKLVVRLTRPDLKANFAGALHWYEPLIQREVPLPKLHYAELDETKHGFPVMVMDRLPGTDLGAVYRTLNEAEKRDIAERIASIQQAVAKFPLGRGYGYGKSAEAPTLLPSWRALLESSLNRSYGRIEKTQIFSTKHVDRVRALLDSHQTYLESIQPVCYLDDTTTKNVIIYDGKLTGIVDVDGVAFGDPLSPIALTYMSLLAAGRDTTYINYWLKAIHATRTQREAMQLYTAIYCLDFMSEMGTVFNQIEPEPIDQNQVQRFLTLLDTLTT